MRVGSNGTRGDRECRLLRLPRGAPERGQACRGRSVGVGEPVGGAEELRFEVRDDGAGLPDGPTQGGAGLTNMRDRVGAVGGRLAIGSVPGEGTCVAGSVPVGPAELPPQVETLLQRATEALEASFGIYRAVRDEGGAVVDFLVEHVNEAARRDFGLPREQLVGQTLCQLFPDYRDSAAFRWQRRVLEDGRADSRVETAHLDDARSARQPRRAVDVSAAPLGAGRLVLTWHDVTRHTRLEEQVRLQSLVLDRADGGGLPRAGLRRDDRSCEPALHRDAWGTRPMSSTGGRWPRSTGRTSRARLTSSWHASPLSSPREGRGASRCATGGRTAPRSGARATSSSSTILITARCGSRCSRS